MGGQRSLRGLVVAVQREVFSLESNGHYPHDDLVAPPQEICPRMILPQSTGHIQEIGATWAIGTGGWTATT